MTVSLSKAKSQFFQWTRVLFIVTLCLGIFFRFSQLDQKVYWHDEVATALRISGFTHQEMLSEVVDGPELEAKQLRKYQYPNSEKGVIDTINSLIVDDTQHPPLFFLLLRFWVTVFGHSLISLRSLAAVFSVLMLPTAWGLCRELFQSKTVGWMAIALLAVSPVQIVYAQEARHYSLWMLLILLSSTALLRALRLSTWQSWTIYGLSVVAGLYTHLFFALIALGHGLYTLFVGQCRWSQNLRAYLLVSGLACVSFIPWLMVLINRDDNLGGVSWMDKPSSFLGMIIRICGVLSRTFTDFGIGPTESLSGKVFVAPLVLLTMAMSLVALIVMIRQTPFRIWFFPVTLAGVTGSVIMLSYLFLGKQIATTRYMLPISLSMHLAVAYLLTESFRFFQHYWGRIAILRILGATLLSAGVLSCLIRLDAPVWWNQIPEIHRDTPAIARLLNQQENSLVIVDVSSGESNLMIFQGLLHFIHQNLNFRVISASDPKPLIQPLQRNTFIYFPLISSSESLKQNLTAKYNANQDIKLERLFDSLWHVLP
jgi:uncharacterized membrane protein